MAIDTWADYRKAYSVFEIQKDSAFYYFNKATSHTEDSVQVAMAYNFMAIIQSDAGDRYGAQESLTLSLKFLNDFNPAHFDCLARDYNELGMNSADLKDHDAALRYYELAAKFHPDSALATTIENNKASALQEERRYGEAIKIYRQQLGLAIPGSLAYARRLTNLAATLWLADPTYLASSNLLLALHIREQNDDVWGLNSSYAHLADYYELTKPDSAIFYANAMYHIATKVNSADDRLLALERLLRFGPVGSAKNYFKIYQELNDSIQIARNAAKNQFAVIRYEVEKHKSDKLQLQKDNTEKKYQILRQQVLLYIALATVIVIGLGLRYRYRKIQRQQQLESQLVIKENEMRTAKKVHDVVANGIYGVMSEIEHQEFLDKDRLLDKMELLYERSRDISYEPPRTESPDFHQHLGKLLLSFATSGTKVILVGNEASFWEKVSTAARYELEHILQELMVNMRKHSGAKNVVLKFEASEGDLLVSYQDDGRGITEGTFFKNGLTSTGNRINAIGGRITFENNTGTGLAIQLCFPRS